MGRLGLLVLVAALPYAGCVSLSTFQTARVLSENESQFVAAASTMSNYALLIEAEGENSIETGTGGTFEALYRTTISRNFDIGVKAYFIGAIIDGKYQFHDTERFDWQPTWASDTISSRVVMQTSRFWTSTRHCS
jgi:hypothetical protein